ncbi:hybrid sensor histidine kinase/response regulator transcription factor [Bacteroides sp. UBA939]|uniref:hybrid sensor histidine kinase/response regulator transcription factor n=1 Tax=Bacteroides sp. UBA939 TaxID=1946092 RepID=UPI0025BF3753|nr:ATP-binding protein [Bacteroides sp. UBA939]
MKNNLVTLKRRFILFAFISWHTCLFAGSFHHLNISEGLSSRQVYQICKDSAGFIWAYTHMGVDRYDGNEIRHYKLDETIESRNHILSFTVMKIDVSGNLWIALRNGRIYKYDSLKDAFHLQTDLSQFLSSTILNDIEFDDGKGLWLCTSTGVYHWSSESNSLSPAGVIGEWTSCIIKSGNDAFYVGTNTGVYRLNRIKATHQLQKEQVALPVEARIESLFLYGRKLYIGTFSNGAFVVELQTGYVKSLNDFVPDIPVRAFAHDKGHAILVGVDGAGIFKIDEADDRLLIHYITDEDDDNSLTGNTVSDICVDEYGGVWVSTNTNGVSYMAFDGADVRWIKHARNNSSSLSSNHVNVMIQDSEGDYWYGTNDGISLYQAKTKRWTHFLNGKRTPYLSVVLALCEDNEGYVWAGGYGIGLHRINKRNGEVRKMPNRDKLSGRGISTDYIYAIHAEGDCLWFGGIEGDFVRYNRRNDVYTYYPINCIGDIKYGDKNTLLLAACDGLGYFDKTTGEVRWQQQFGDVTLNYPVRCLFRSSSGDIWLLTDGEGLIRFNPQTEKSRIYTVADGLASNSINSIVEDNNGYIWFNTEKELYCLDLIEDIVMDGNDLLNIGWGYYNANAALRTKDGHLAFGTAQGVLVFTPAFDFSRSMPVELIFTDFKLPYESVIAGMPGSPLKAGINETQHLKLEHDQNSFSISFSAINFVSPHKVRYEYRLKDHEQQWHRVDAVRSVDYMDLSPGRYTFELRAFDKYTQLQVGERAVDIHIARSSWASWWAISIYLLFLFVLAYLFIQFMKQRMRENKINEKIQSFIGIAHDLRTPVTLIKLPLSELEMQADLPEESRKKLDVAVKNAEKLFTMITQLLDLQKTEARSEYLEVMFYNIQSYLEDKLSAFHMAAMRKDIELYLEVEPGMPEVWLDKDKMDHIMDNLLSNALKYTEKGSIGVIVGQSKSKWSITVKDTGIGIPEEEQKNIFNEYYRAKNVMNLQEQGIGMGLMITCRIIKQHHGRIEFRSKENEGSAFTITFPKKLKSGMVIAVNEELQETMKVSSSRIEKEQTGKNTLLLAEDDKDMRDYLVDSLSSEYKVVSVPDGGKALEMAKEMNPDIIISDIMMPVIQGDELCRILKSSVETSHIPVVLLTALSERENIILGLEAGANDYVIKPFDLSVLKVRLRNILQSRQHLREKLLSINISNAAPIDDVDYGSHLDKEFLDAALEIINDNMSNQHFSISDFCNLMGMSRTSTYNKIKTLTGLPPNDLIRFVRLNKAKEILALRNHGVGEVATMVGFADAKYFSTCFKRQFGVRPSNL